MNIIFNSSLPRSGSTLIQNLLAQNSNNYCTPTNDLIELIVQIRNSYGNFDAFRSQGVMQISPRIKTAMRGLLEGFYQSEIKEGKTIIDKSRGWIAYIELMEEILERPVKIIVCVRDLRDICASFEKLYRTNQLTKIDVNQDAYFDCQTVEGRTYHLLSNDAVVGMAINRLRDAFNRKVDDRLIIIPYNKLINSTVETIFKVTSICGIEPFLCNPNNIVQKTQEDDSIHGMKLHTIRNNIDTNASSWEQILPKDLADEINERFPFIQELAGVKNENT